MSKRRMDRRAFVRAVGTAAGVSGAAEAFADTSEPTTEPPMAELSDLHRAVAGVLQNKQVGVPVFVRYTLQLARKENALVNPLAQVVAVVRGWINQDLAKVYASEVAGVEVSGLLEFTGGATALVSVVRRTAGPDAVDLILLGNQGAIYHETTSVHADLPIGKADAKLLRAIERSLQSRKPEEAS
jgi:hypothetical protein